MTADQIECRRLARAVGADDGVALALRHAQIQIVDDADIAKALFDGADFDGRGRGKGDGGRHARYPRSRATVAALSQASAIRRHVSRATPRPPTTRTAATSHVSGDAGAKAMPNRWIGSPPAYRAIDSIPKMTPQASATVGTMATR